MTDALFASATIGPVLLFLVVTASAWLRTRRSVFLYMLAAIFVWPVVSAVVRSAVEVRFVEEGGAAEQLLSLLPMGSALLLLAAVRGFGREPNT